MILATGSEGGGKLIPRVYRTEEESSTDARKYLPIKQPEGKGIGPAFCWTGSATLKGPSWIAVEGADRAFEEKRNLRA